MLDKRKATRDALENSSRTEFYALVKEAKLTPRQEEILEMRFVKDYSYVQIAFYFYLDVNKIKVDMKKAYDKLEEEGFVVTIHGKGTYIAPTDKQLAIEARRKAVEDDFTQAIAKARTVGMEDDEIREIVEIILEE